MNAENDSKFHVKEQTFLFTKKPLTIVKKTDDALETSNLQNSEMNSDAHSMDNVNLEEQKEVADKENIEITIWGNRKIYINTYLISLRAAQFLWFASGGLSMPFFSLMLTHRGLTLTQFSSVFSMIFPFQLTVAFVGGIIADKLGNAKPVLIFLILASLSSVIGLLLYPNVRENSCFEYDSNTTCLSIFNYTSYLENCKHTCCLNNTDYFSAKTLKIDSNDSFEFSKGFHVLNSTENFEDTFYSNETVIFCYAICSCLSKSLENCSSASKSGLRILYYALILSYFSVWSTAFRFFDFAASNIAKQHNSNFGKERIFAALGKFVAALLCNFVLNIDKSRKGGYYDNVYWFVVLLKALALLSAWKIRKFILPPGLKLTKKTLKLFSDIEIVSMIIIVFVAGTGFTFNSFFHLWFLNRLKASKIIIGLHVMTDSFYAIPIYATSEWWLRKLGTKKIVIICLLSYALSGISYSFLYYPWISLIIEVTKAFTLPLFWVAIIRHCVEIAPEGFSATVTAIIGSIHFGIGRSFSVPVGGYLISTFGARITYRLLAGFCLVTAILYSVFLYLRHRCSKRNNKKRSKDCDEMKSMRENEA